MPKSVTHVFGIKCHPQIRKDKYVPWVTHQGCWTHCQPRGQLSAGLKDRDVADETAQGGTCSLNVAALQGSVQVRDSLTVRGLVRQPDLRARSPPGGSAPHVCLALTQIFDGWAQGRGAGWTLRNEGFEVGDLGRYGVSRWT
jgi:hypothetical protein